MKIFSLIKSMPKRFSVAAVIVAAVAVPAIAAAWGPSRPTFTVENPSDHVVFDSITNNPDIGDERNFVSIRQVGSTGLWQDSVTVQPGQEYVVRMYVHNDAASSLNLVAHNVTAKFDLPTTTGTSIDVNGFIDASNIGANATGNAGSFGEIWDQATFNGTSPFNLAYETGTLHYNNNGFGPNGVAIPESVFTSTGAALGYDHLDGNIPGCFQYSGYLTFTVKPQFAPTDSFSTTKQVRKLGDTTWSKSVNVTTGDTVQYQITYKNTGAANEYNVIVNDTLPQGVTYVPGSTILTNPNYPSGKAVSDNLMTAGGINISSYKPGSVATLVFNAKVTASVAQLACGANTLVNKERTTANGGFIEDTANVVINNATCGPTPPQLPHTGASENIVAFFGLGALIASVVYYVRSRRLGASL